MKNIFDSMETVILIFLLLIFGLPWEIAKALARFILANLRQTVRHGQ